jgi:nitroreductase
MEREILMAYFSNIEIDMNVTQAVTSRRSIRQFLDKSVDRDTLERVLTTAQRSPSGGNTQPWNAVVLTGDPLRSLIDTVTPFVMQGRAGFSSEYDVYPKRLEGRYEESRRGVGEDMYAALQIPREDKPARLKQFAANFRGFDAPVVLFIHTPRYMGPPQWADIGMWLQTVMLLLREVGLDSCAQEAWAAYAAPVRAALKLPDDHIFFCGLAIGYRDADAPVNGFDVPRVALDDAIRWDGF